MTGLPPPTPDDGPALAALITEVVRWTPCRCGDAVTHGVALGQLTADLLELVPTLRAARALVALEGGVVPAIAAAEAVAAEAADERAVAPPPVLRLMPSSPGKETP